MPPGKRAHGFALIELLIVVAIILIIAAIAIPRYLSSRALANEASAVSSVRAIISAQINYASSYPSVGYADTLSKLRTPAPGDAPSLNAAGYLDSVLACSSQPCPRSGYKFSIAEPKGEPVSTYRIIAVPVQAGITGMRGFCADQEGHVSYDSKGGSSCTALLQ